METATENASETAAQTVLMETRMGKVTRMEMARMGINVENRTELDLTETETEAAESD